MGSAGTVPADHYMVAGTGDVTCLATLACGWQSFPYEGAEPTGARWGGTLEAAGAAVAQDLVLKDTGATALILAKTCSDAWIAEALHRLGKGWGAWIRGPPESVMEKQHRPPGWGHSNLK